MTALAGQTVRVQENDIALLFNFSAQTSPVQASNILQSGFDIAKISTYVSLVGAQSLTKTSAKGIVGQTFYKIPASGLTPFDLKADVKTKEELTRLFFTLTSDVMTLTAGADVAIPHGLLDPACLLKFPLFSGIKVGGSTAGEQLESSRKLGMGLLFSYTCSQIVLNQVGLDDVTRLTAHSSYAQLASQSSGSKYIPLSGLASASLSAGGRDVSWRWSCCICSYHVHEFLVCCIAFD